MDPHYNLPDQEQMKQLGWRPTSIYGDSYLSQDACRRLQFDPDMESVFLQQRARVNTGWTLRGMFRYIDPSKDLLPILSARRPTPEQVADQLRGLLQNENLGTRMVDRIESLRRNEQNKKVRAAAAKLNIPL